jgi:non-canonical poly(A) RNA polymerase PAPD5/7
VNHFFLLPHLLICRQKKLSIRKMTMIRTARIPLIKLETNSKVVADISLGDASGPRAANYIAQQVGGVWLFG